MRRVSKVISSILDAVERGVSVQELREDLAKHVLSGEKQKIVLNLGGEDLKLSPEIVEEMARRGDPEAQDILARAGFATYRNAPELRFAHLTRGREGPDRTNPILIEIIQEEKLKNNAGMDLAVFEVPVEKWAYKIRHQGVFGAEYLEEYIPPSSRCLALLPG